MKGIVYFVKFAYKNSKAYLITRLISEVLSIALVMLQMIMPMYILNSVFVYKDIKSIVIYISLFLGLNFIGNMLNIYILKITEVSKSTLKYKFDEYIAKLNMSSEITRLESSDYQNIKQNAELYIGGQWNEFGDAFEKCFIFFGALMKILVAFVVISKLSIWLLLIFVLLVVINTGVNSSLKNKRMELVSKFSTYLRKVRYFDEITQNRDFIKEIKLYGLSKWILNAYSNEFNGFHNQTSKIHKQDLIIKGAYSSTNLIQQGVTYGSLIYYTMYKGLNIGEFSLVLSSINTFNDQINVLIDAFLNIKKYTGYYGFFEKYVEVSKTNDRVAFTDMNKDDFEIEFRNVDYIYPNQDYRALNNVSMKINSKNTYMIVGENGAGKTTFVKLLTKLYKPTAGEILLNGVNIQNISNEIYYEMLSLVFQDYATFALSVKENIAFVNNSDFEGISRASKEAGIYEKINSLPNTFDSYLYQDYDLNGIILSGGETQKLAVARALYKDSPILILDEPLASLDVKYENEFYKSIKENTKNKTIMFISHRLSSAKYADRIIVFSNGEIIQQGTHEELKFEGEYAEMYNIQLNRFTEK